MRRIVIILSGLLVLAVLGVGIALAQGPRHGGGPHGGPGMGGPGPDGGFLKHVVFGELNAIDDDLWTIIPRIPEEMATHMQDMGHELPELPAEVVIKLGPDTRYGYDGEEASAAAFSVGMDVVVMLGPQEADPPVARGVADPDTARKFMQERMQQMGGPGFGGPGKGMGRKLAEHITFGKVSSINDNELVIAPELPPMIAEKLAESGREAPELPAEVKLRVDSNTEFFLNGAEADAGSFSPGDTVIALKRPSEDGELAWKVADPETAREYFRQMGEKMGGGMGPGGGMGGPGMGPGGGRGERGGQGRGRPVFGTISEITDDRVTISIELPGFVLDHMAERGVEVPADLPESVTLALGARTHYLVDNQPADDNPFSIGDKVAVMAGRNDDSEPVAFAIVDWATVELRIAEGGGPRDGAGRRGGGRKGQR